MKPRMMIGRCCCGSPDCFYCQDAFNRADSTDIDTGSSCGWTEQSGNPTIATNELSFPAAGIATSDTTQAGTDPQIHVAVNAEVANEGDTARIVFNFVDTSNYSYFEMVGGNSSNGSIRLVNVASGTPTTLDENTGITISTGFMHGLCLAYTNDRIVATWIQTGGGSIETVFSDLTGVNGVVGLGTDSGCLFDDFAFQRHNTLQAGCGDCDVDCGSCSEGSGPGFFMLVLSGAANSGCSSCGDYNTNFLLPARETTRKGTLACAWYDDFSGLGCETTGTLQVDVGVYVSGGNTQIQATFDFDVGGSQPQTSGFAYAGSSGEEACFGFSAKDIPWTSDLGTRCNLSGSTLELSAIV